MLSGAITMDIYVSRALAFTFSLLPECTGWYSLYVIRKDRWRSMHCWNYQLEDGTGTPAWVAHFSQGSSTCYTLPHGENEQ